MVRKVTGGVQVVPEKEKEKKEGEDEPSGVQVDFYLVIVGCSQSEYSSVVEAWYSSSSSLLVSSLPSRSVTRC